MHQPTDSQDVSTQDRRPHPPGSVLREAAVAGSLASALSALVLCWAGAREVRSAVAPLNAVSHWCWGKPALWARALNGRHTLLGYAIHHGAALGWAALHAAVMRKRGRAGNASAIWAGAAATSAVACVVDFRCTPERLTPGFEHHLSRSALAGVYAAFGLGLALGALAMRADRREPTAQMPQDTP